MEREKAQYVVLFERENNSNIFQHQHSNTGTELAVIDKYGRPVKGGCCTWYDEHDLLSQVETRLGSEIPTMSPTNLNLPPQISDAMKRGVLFGSSAEFQGTVKSDEALRALRRAVKNLNELEIRAQRSFFEMARQFGSK